MDLLNLCLTSTYFQYNSKHYKQLRGTAMGSTVSVVVAEIVMQNIEEQALEVILWTPSRAYLTLMTHSPPYTKTESTIFTNTLTDRTRTYRSPRRSKKMAKIPFLDCLVTRDNNKLKTTIYRKLTHTDRLLDQSSYNPTSHKATTIVTRPMPPFGE